MRHVLGDAARVWRRSPTWRETPLTTADESVLALARADACAAHPGAIHALGDLMLAIRERVDLLARPPAWLAPPGRRCASVAGHRQRSCAPVSSPVAARSAFRRASSAAISASARRAARPAGHAWADAWIDALRLGQLRRHPRPAWPGRAYCRLAVGRDYLDACPVRGAHAGSRAAGDHRAGADASSRVRRAARCSAVAAWTRPRRRAPRRI
ncbi:MAG: hypothetical protein MZW92_28835 [Comamonadaceae bacterium]|nr:hypothetical protein [Comamonadaceae bacterium]